MLPMKRIHTKITLAHLNNVNVTLVTDVIVLVMSAKEPQIEITFKNTEINKSTAIFYFLTRNFVLI